MRKKLKIANLFGDAIKGYEMGEKLLGAPYQMLSLVKKGKYLKN